MKHYIVLIISVKYLKMINRIALDYNYLDFRSEVLRSVNLPAFHYIANSRREGISFELANYLTRTRDQFAETVIKIRSAAAYLNQFPTARHYLKSVFDEIMSEPLSDIFLDKIIVSMWECSFDNPRRNVAYAMSLLEAFSGLYYLTHKERVRRRLDEFAEPDGVPFWQISDFQRANYLIASSPLVQAGQTGRSYALDPQLARDIFALHATYANGTSLSSRMSNLWQELLRDADYFQTLEMPSLESAEARLTQALQLQSPSEEPVISQDSLYLYNRAFQIIEAKRKAKLPIDDADAAQIIELYKQTGSTKPPAIWAGLLADVYDSKNHSLTDHVLAREMLTLAALSPEGSAEAFNLAQNYFNPPPGKEIDNKRAAFWFTMAARTFDEARVLAIRLINYHDELAELRGHLPALINTLNYDLSDPTELHTAAGRFLARAHNSGLYGFSADQTLAQAYYHAVATRNVDWSPYILPTGLKYAKRDAALAAATRSLLGIGTSFDTQAAEAYAQLLYNDCDADDIDHTNKRRAAIRIQAIAKTMGEAGKEQQVQEVLTIVRAIVSRNIPPQWLTALILSGNVKSTDLLEGCLSLLQTYLENDCVGYPSYRSCIAEVQIRLLGHTQSHAVENQFRYNAIDATHVPILGAIEPPSENGASIQGFGRFRGFSVTPNGEIHFSFDPANSNQLPLLVPEDVEVALALAFGDVKPIWPRFSAEPPAPLTPTSPDWIPFTARWMPQWLGHTALGNTLFATDCEAGPLVLNQIANVQVAPDQRRDPSLDRLRQVVDRMKAVHERHSGHGNFLTFTVAAVELTWSQTDDGALRCAANKSVVGLQTGTFDEHDKRSYTNNMDFAGGYRAAIFNANYDLFAEHYPLLERFRQLAILVTSLNQLRERGFEPAPPIRKAITESYNGFVCRPAPAQASQLFY